MKQGSLRQVRVADLLKETLSDLILRKVKDPRVHEVTITGVDVSVDLKHARVFFCVRDAEVKEEALNGLNSAEGFLHHELKTILDLKNIPKLEFSYDTSFDYGSRIDEILEQIKSHEESGR
jgi:ribosome-binding factor A